MAVPLTIIIIAMLAIPLATAQALGFSEQQTGSWLFALYAIPGVLSLAMAHIYRQPLFFGWNGFVVVFLASLTSQVRFADLLGATLIGGAIVACLGAFGLTARVAAYVPAPVVFAVLAASVLPFVASAFTGLSDEPLVIAGTLAAYVLGRRFLGARVPAILPALIAGLILAGVAGRYGSFPVSWVPPPLLFTMPTFSLPVVLTVVPVFVALTAFQANLTAVVFLRDQDYAPPTRSIEIVSGVGSIVGSVLGPVPIGLVAVLTPLTAGPEAGDREIRHWSVYTIGTIAVLIGLGAGMAAQLPAILPLPLLLAIAGLALVSVLAQALGEMVRGPLLLGPLFAFVAASSTFSLFGLGPLFWALVVGSGVSLVLEAKPLRELRVNVAAAGKQ